MADCKEEIGGAPFYHQISKSLITRPEMGLAELVFDNILPYSLIAGSARRGGKDRLIAKLSLEFQNDNNNGGASCP